MENNNINLFKKNFFCDNEETIKEIYLKKSDIFLFNNLVIFKNDKYLHPLFLNYNYCYFCFDKRKTKYFTKNLIESHNNDIPIFDYIKNKNIKLKKGINKKEKLIRRFIHSFDNNKNIKNKISTNSNVNSDTELYLDINIKHNENNNNNLNSEVNNERNTLKSHEFSSITSKENSKSEEMNLEMILNIDNERKNDKMMKIKSHMINENKLKFQMSKGDIQEKTKISGVKKTLNKSSDFLLVNEIQNKKSKINYFSIIKNLAFGKDKKFKRHNSIRKHKKKGSIIISNNINKDDCSICLGEIKEKYTLVCGDFFCRECIYERIKSILKCISDFDKIRCPLCNEIIEENTLKRLLNEKEFNFYEKIKMRIEGLKNKNLIPCPFPDCEGFANKANIHKNNIYFCQNNHYFCEKCMEVVDKKLLLEKKKHLCKVKDIQTMKYFKLKMKKNIIKKCPNCDCWVQKEQNSCNNVICSNIWCKLEFCWICKSPYDDYHYKNPFSMCFGLSSINSENYFTKNKRMRLIRCMIIFFIIIFLLLPFSLIFFSFLEILIYVFGFLIDKSGLGNAKFKTKFTHNLFYKILILFYFFISIGLIPVGFFSLVFIIFVIPFIYLFNKIKNNDTFN